MVELHSNDFHPLQILKFTTLFRIYCIPDQTQWQDQTNLLMDNVTLVNIKLPRSIAAALVPLPEHLEPQEGVLGLEQAPQGVQSYETEFPRG